MKPYYVDPKELSKIQADFLQKKIEYLVTSGAGFVTEDDFLSANNFRLSNIVNTGSDSITKNQLNVILDNQERRGNELTDFLKNYISNFGELKLDYIQTLFETLNSNINYTIGDIQKNNLSLDSTAEDKKFTREECSRLRVDENYLPLLEKKIDELNGLYSTVYSNDLNQSAYDAYVFEQ